MKTHHRIRRNRTRRHPHPRRPSSRPTHRHPHLDQLRRHAPIQHLPRSRAVPHLRAHRLHQTQLHARHHRHLRRRRAAHRPLLLLRHRHLQRTRVRSIPPRTGVSSACASHRSPSHRQVSPSCGTAAPTHPATHQASAPRNNAHARQFSACIAPSLLTVSRGRLGVLTLKLGLLSDGPNDARQSLQRLLRFVGVNSSFCGI